MSLIPLDTYHAYHVFVFLFWADIQTHLICRIPDYPRKDVVHPVHCQIVALSGGKVSDPQDFVYKPGQSLPLA